MAIEYGNRVSQPTTSMGTGLVVPSGGYQGFFTFAASFSPGATVGYFIEAEDGTSVEVGTAPWTGTGIDRSDPSAVIESSTAGAAPIDLPAGTHRISSDATAANIVALARTDELEPWGDARYTPIAHSAATLDGAPGHVSAQDRIDWDAADVAAHSHDNKSALDLVENTGDGTQYLSDDGTYNIPNAVAIVHRVCNETGGTITRGKVVYFTGAAGVNDLPLVDVCTNTDPAKMPAEGFVLYDLADGTEGLMARLGTLYDLNTAGYQVGDSLYVTTNGDMSSSPPSTGEVQKIGEVEVVDPASGAAHFDFVGYRPPEAFDFTDLNDTPASYIGQAGKLIKVAVTEDGLIFGSPAGTTIDWGEIGGNLNNQNDLFLELQGKTDVAHSDSTIDGAAGHVSTLDRSNWDSASGESHAHANKGLLDTYAQAEADLANAVSHSQTTTGNPHGLDAGDVGADPAGTGAAEVAAHEAKTDPTGAHDIGGIDGLQTALDSKSDDAHSHDIYPLKADINNPLPKAFVIGDQWLEFTESDDTPVGAIGEGAAAALMILATKEHANLNNLGKYRQLGIQAATVAINAVTGIKVGIPAAVPNSPLYTGVDCGCLVGGPQPNATWETPKTGTNLYPLGSGTGTGSWVEVTELAVTLPQDVAADDVLAFGYRLYANNAATDASGELDIGWSIDAGAMTQALTYTVTEGYHDPISGTLSLTGTGYTTGQVLKLHARIKNGTGVGYSVGFDPAKADHLARAWVDEVPGLDGKVAKAGDTMTGTLNGPEFNAVHTPLPYVPVGDEVGGHGLESSDDADLKGGLVLARDPGDNVTEVAVGTVSETMGLRLRASYTYIDTASVLFSVPGADLGSRLICSGVNSRGDALVGWERPPEATYTEQKSDTRDLQIGSGNGTGSWVTVTTLDDLTEDCPEVLTTISYQLYCGNPGNKQTSVEVSVRVDGVAPTVWNTYPLGTTSTGVAISAVFNPAVDLTAGQSLELVVRHVGTHTSSNSWLEGTITGPSTLTLTKAATGGGGGGETNNGVNLAGGDVQVYQGMSGFNLTFRPFGNAGAIEWTNNADVLEADLADTAVTPGAYTLADITIDQQGRITAAASGTATLPDPAPLLKYTEQVQTVSGGASATTYVDGRHVVVDPDQAHTLTIEFLSGQTAAQAAVLDVYVGEEGETVTFANGTGVTITNDENADMTLGTTTGKYTRYQFRRIGTSGVVGATRIDTGVAL